MTAKYHILRKKKKNGSWEVWWNGKRVFRSTNIELAENQSAIFADALERGITGSRESLGSHSRVKIRGWMTYLSAFPTYEDYR